MRRTEITCAGCGNVFTIENSAARRRRHCSMACRCKAQTMPVEFLNQWVAQWELRQKNKRRTGPGLVRLGGDLPCPCGERAKAKGLCGIHYKQYWHGRHRMDLGKRRKHRRECAVFEQKRPRGWWEKPYVCGKIAKRTA